MKALTTCDTCLQGSHRLCKGRCACRTCESRPRAVHRDGRCGPRMGRQGQNNPNPGNFSDPLPADKLVGIMQMIRNYQLTGELEVPNGNMSKV